MREFVLMVAIFIGIPVLLIGVAVVIDKTLYAKVHAFEHECELDQGIVTTSNRDTFCIYPKENKIKRFE